MKKSNIILYKSCNRKRKDVTVSNVEEWIKKQDISSIAEFIYNRHYSRYLKIFDFAQEEFRNKYKNGFTIMANCCLVIETLESFFRGWASTNGKSELAFLKFFTRLKIFSVFSTEDIPTQFYKHIRCGILHQGETTGGWRITRDATSPMLDKTNKRINATKFHTASKSALETYKHDLEECSWGDALCKNAIKKLKAVIRNCE